MPSLRVLNQSFECPLPYGEGHVCTAAEASELNRLRTQRVAALARKAIQEGKGKADLEHLAREYNFTAPPFTMPSDPVEQEAMKIAKSLVQAALAKAGNRQLEDHEFAQRIRHVAQREDIQAEAERRIRRLREVTAQSLDIDFNEEGAS